MSWWLLLLMVFVVWLLWGVAAAAARAVSDARGGIPEGQRGGVSIAPVIPIFPLGFWGAALLADWIAGPWGTVVIGWFHALLGVVFTVSIGRDVWRLRSLDKIAGPGAAADRPRE
jgi:hypothetical protein